MDFLTLIVSGGAPLDPTASGWINQVLALLGLVAALVVALRWWFAHRRR